MKILIANEGHFIHLVFYILGLSLYNYYGVIFHLISISYVFLLVSSFFGVAVMEHSPHCSKCFEKRM